MVSDQFDRLMQSYGGRLHEGHILHPSTWIWLKLNRDFLQELLKMNQRLYLQESIQKDQWQNSPAGVEFDLLANMDVNALASSRDGYEAMGLNAGLVMFVLNTFWALLSGDLLLPSTSNATVEKSKPDLIAEYIVNVDFNKSWGDLHPRDKSRLSLATDLAQLAMIFVFYHEMCHITYGHLLHNELRTLSKDSTIFEYYRDAIPISPRLLQAMEFDADEGATVRSVDFVLMLLEQRPILFGQSSKLERLHYWVLSLTILFRILDLFTKSPEINLLSSHPLPGARMDHIVYCALGHVHDYFSEELSTFEAAIQRGLREVSGLWDILGLPSVSHELDATQRAIFSKSLRDDLLRYDKIVLNDLFQMRGNLIRQRHPNNWR